MVTSGTEGVEAVRIREGAGACLLRDDQVVKITAAFKVLDTDRSGEMDLEEFVNGVAMLGLESTREGLIALYRGDGMNGEAAR